MVQYMYSEGVAFFIYVTLAKRVKFDGNYRLGTLVAVMYMNLLERIG